MREVVIPMLLLLCSCAAGNSVASRIPDQKSTQSEYTKLISPNKLKEDVDFLFRTIEEVHPNMYAYTSKEELNPLREGLYENVKFPMNRLQFYKLVAPVVASLKNGHTFIFVKYEGKSGIQLGCKSLSTTQPIRSEDEERR